MPEIRFIADDDLQKQDSGSKIRFTADTSPELPTIQEQGVSVAERMAVGALSGDRDTQLDFLKKAGYMAEQGPNDTIKVRRPDDKEWKVVDPEGLTSIGDALQDVKEAIPAAAATIVGAGPAGTAVKSSVKFIPSIMKRIINLSPTVRGAKKAASTILGAKGVEKILNDILGKD